MRSIRQYQSRWIVVIGLLCVFGSVYGAVVHYQRQDMQELALMYEVRTLRDAVVAFYYVNERFPESLGELAKAEFADAAGQKRFFLPERFRKQKEFTGPLGARYAYDPKTGSVKIQDGPYSEW